MPPADADVIVIGGGAAGTSAAIHLARQGRRVILLEGSETRPPRLSDLHSGEVLSPGSQQELARLGLSDSEPDGPSLAGPEYLRRWKLQEWNTLVQRWPGGRCTRDRLPEGLRFWQLNRGQFYRSLQGLAQAEGVAVQTGLRVVNLLQGQAGACQGVVARSAAGAEQVSLFAPVVVDASGRNSVVLARLRLKEAEPEFGRVAYLFFFSRLEGEAGGPGVWQQFWLPGTTTLRGSQLAPALYRYSFETSLAEREKWLKRWGRLPPFDLFLKVLAEQLPQEAARFREAERLPHMLAFAPIGFRVRQITHDGLLMVGDASGYLDPSTGQGIEFALRLGRLAANSIAEAFQRNRFDRAVYNRYLEGRRAEVQPIMRNLRLFLRFSQRHWLLDTVGGFSPLRKSITRQLVTPRPALK